MKILKPGKVEMRKFVCPNCGCEFVIEGGVDIILWKHKEGWGKVPIVRCLCGEEIELHDGEPYEEPTQSDLERMASLVYDAPQANANSWSEAAKMIAQYLIDHGVTFREG